MNSNKPTGGFSEAPHYLGHRQRLRERFTEHGADAFPDYELLEMFLFRSVPRRDTKKMAKDLIQRFGSFAEVIGAPLERLTEVSGIGESVATDLKLVEAAVKRVTKRRITERKSLGSWSEVIDHCRASMAFDDRESFRCLFLDKKNGLILDEVQGRGTVDHTPVYPREVMRRALELSASALVLVHNHPSGDPSPSTADVKMTLDLIAIGKPMGIAIHDHIIVGRNGHASLKGLGVI